MKKRVLGKTGFQVSEIGLGCWQLGGDFGPVGEEQASAILGHAHGLGVNFWDTADVYGGGLSESRIGKALPDAPDTIVVTKFGRGGDLFPDNCTLDGVRDSLEGSRDRLGVEAIDLAQIHCVPTHVLQRGEIFDILARLKSDGLIKNWGASVETIEEGLICLEQEDLASLQIIFNLFRQDAAQDLLPAAKDKNVGIIVRLPLASGLLSGKFAAGHKFDATDHRHYNRDGQSFSVGETFAGIPFEKAVEMVDQIETICPPHYSMVDLALRWILDHDAVSSVIAGVTKPDQLSANVAATAQPSLDTTLKDQLQSFYLDQVRPLVRGQI